MSRPTRTRRERGMALITSLLLLIIITLLALSMFRSYGTQEKIAGNLREKDRALHAAESAQEYGEWWLLQGNNAAIGAVPCTAGLLNGTLGQGQICSNRLDRDLGLTIANIPWVTAGAGGGAIGVTFQPQTMAIASLGQAGTAGNPAYFSLPTFYIADLGPSLDGQGEAYRVDAFGYGSSQTTVAVVESTYEVSQGVVNRSGL
ncbi:MAG TPA: PilX N-terminal domain-containing pilus assembly protein [Steroidobacteraceae bacterium]|jgi:type IV pilus assembly protein PilX|nr:PilX N-terminal domain-containing pilus assembly protein [Steroidobacteraceae bacterium]